MTPATRLYRAMPPEYFKEGITAWLNPATNVVTYNMEQYDLRASRDLRRLRELDDDEHFYMQPR